LASAVKWRLNNMLTELRTYDFAPGDALRYLDLFRREGLHLITGHLPLAGYWLTEIGPLNRLHHLWVYRDLADRTARRSAFMADEAWTRGFLPKGMALIRRQESRLLVLQHGSPAFSAVASQAAQLHDGRQMTGAMLSSSWATLQIAAEAPAANSDRLAIWRVAAGDGAGAFVTAHLRPDAKSVPFSDVGNGSFEICRPTSFSPLR
jgi:hypothetical protein